MQSDMSNTDNAGQSISLKHIVRQFMKYPMHEKVYTVAGVLRFYMRYVHIFETSDPIVIGPRVQIYRRKYGRIRAGKAARISRGCEIISGTGRTPNLLSIGERAVIGPNCRIMAATNVTIGARTMISWNCSIFDSIGHRMWLKDQEEAEIEAPISIGDDVWIGSNSIIMKGVTIGNNRIIGAGSVVRRDCPPNSLVIGNPARVAGWVDRWER